jgi:multisubunit Na+/H+ antiporter MnhF subunit
VEKDFTDIALVYALINFISTIVILKYYEDREKHQ